MGGSRASLPEESLYILSNKETDMDEEFCH